MDSKINSSGSQGDRRVDQHVEQEGVLPVGEEQKQVVPEQKDVSDLKVEDVPNNHDNVKEESLLQREVEAEVEADPVGNVFGIPELVGKLLGLLSNEDVKSMATVSKDVDYAAQGYMKSAEGKGRDAVHRAAGYEMAGELDKAMVVYAEYAAEYAPARERLEAFCFACKVFSPALKNHSMDDLKGMSAHDLVVATGDALEALGGLNPQAIKTALVAYCSDDTISAEDREAVLGTFFDTVLLVLGSAGGKEHAPLRQVAREIAIRYPEAFLKLYDAGRVPEKFAQTVFKDYYTGYSSPKGSITSHCNMEWNRVELTGNRVDRENTVRHVVALGVRLGYSLPDIIENIFSFKTGDYNLGMAGAATVGLESLPKVLMEHAKLASSDKDVVSLVKGIETILKSDFPGIKVQDKVELVRVLISLLPRVETSETREQIVQLLESQMHASTLYRAAKGVGEAVLGFFNAVGGSGDAGLFQGEIDDYVGKDFAALFFNMDMDTIEAWMDSGGEYYVALALENTGEYLDGLGIEGAAERNKVEATLIALGDRLLEGPHGNSDTLSGAVSVQRHSIAQATNDIGVLDGQGYLDALEE